MTTLYEQDIEASLAETVGRHGLPRAALAERLEKAQAARSWLRDGRDRGALPFLTLPGRRDDLGDLQDLARRLVERFAAIVILGTGGSSLGAQTLLALAPHERRGRLHLPDNLDGAGFAALLERLDPASTAFVVVSKSGGTAETLAQALAAMAWLAAGVGVDAIGERTVAIVAPGDNPLRRLAARHDMALIDHDPDLGGRFSVLSAVGLLPALMAGLDAAAVRAGGEAVLAKFFEKAESPPLVGAAIAVGLCEKCAIASDVVLAYADRLERLTAWHRQLWAESLGKDGKGLTPIAALGPVDQHSQLQLWLDGPADKWFTIIRPASEGTGPAIDLGLAGEDPALGYLSGRTIGDLVAAEARATADALVNRGRPVRTIALSRLDEASLGALLMHFMLETAVAAHLMGVDPFGQPAVEEGKRLARAYLQEES